MLSDAADVVADIDHAEGTVVDVVGRKILLAKIWFIRFNKCKLINLKIYKIMKKYLSILYSIGSFFYSKIMWLYFKENKINKFMGSLLIFINKYLCFVNQLHSQALIKC
jgi:hypothetical protein